MSDSMAFVAGAAVAGIAALLLFRGTGNPLENSPPPNLVPSPPAAVQPQPTPLPVPTTPTLNPVLEQQRLDIEKLKAQLEQQRNDAEQLRQQLRNQQITLEAVRSQASVNALNPPPIAPPALPTTQPQPANNSSIGSAMLWALAGMILTLVIGIVVVVAFALFAQQQRPSRTVQVIQPMQYPPSLPARRRQQFQPPRMRDSSERSLRYRERFDTEDFE
ncbi:hypothetical protein NG798_14345 [Ancylothrix sp. C2]|uniref:hypothetical protein n=1 Tax=Ancylothrix sp. D3o TaxID=2953691 RepID=UPI0021BA7404|nr:hypothetical protein [Ancylothrix sp. D3o]MCT7950976.1 hypothetical protein [Ancylothrix sp. D3o]